VHPYFTRRSWRVVQAYTERFSRKGDLVVDPFGGSGVTAIEALVLGRRACQVDLNPLANFIARQVAVSPVSLEAIVHRFHELRELCEPRLALWRRAGEPELARALEGSDYPRNIPLPRNADTQFVHELFTPRQLVGLACLRQEIARTANPTVRDLLLLAFSATLAKTNRTFISAAGRKPSRGGASIFSLYRYNVPGSPVELDVWEQFAARVNSLLTAKHETNDLIGDWYSGETFRAITGSATRLTDLVGAETADYIYTDPPYGGHIAYLDLSTMWNAWLGFSVTEADRGDEVIEGGDVGHTSDDYTRLLEQSIEQMFAVLKPGRWLSLVFCHRDLSYWATIRDSAERVGFRHVNTVVQPLDVVWSMHRKKNPLRVLAGELVINFLKPARKARRPQPRLRPSDVTLLRTIKLCAEQAICDKGAATTEEIYYVLIPRVLESGLATEATSNGLDLVATLRKQGFLFNDAWGRWEVPAGHRFDPDIPTAVRARAYLRQCLAEARAQGRLARLSSVLSYVAGRLADGDHVSEEVVLRELHCVGRAVQGDLWELREASQQMVMF
jgi:16S rRNA G966 N2-methylase RsmD